MAVKKQVRGKVIIQRAGGTIFDIRNVPVYEGHGRDRRVKTSSYGIFIGKRNLKVGFKNIDSVLLFLKENSDKYDKKDKKFKN